jgi:hypothetical protein
LCPNIKISRTVVIQAAQRLDVFGGILLALILFGVCNLQSWLERWNQERHFEDWPTGVPIRDGDHLAGQRTCTSAPSAG